MKNITKLSCWSELQSIAAFIPVNYSGHGRILAIGASLMTPYNSDIIRIEPTTINHSDGRNYHITGNYITGGRCNNHYKASEMVTIIKTLKTTL